MLRRAFWAVFAVACLIAPVAVQAQGDYLDVYVVKAKPDKSSELQELGKKIVDANRRYNGDTWIAMETVYGDGDTMAFVSTRQDYADTEKGNAAFMNALEKAYGKEGTDKLLRDWSNCLLSSRNELRKRRWDLSRKAPDAASYGKFIGDSRVLRTTAVHVRPGRVLEFEALLKDTKAAGEKNPDTQPLLVSQVMEGGSGTVFYITSLRAGIGGFDKNPTTHDILGDEGYKKFLQTSAEIVESTDYALMRFSPEMSNPPKDVLAAAPDFWQPKAVVATKTKNKKPVEQAAAKAKD